MGDCVIGVIGGSGVYDIAGLEGGRWIDAESAFGTASDQILMGRIAGVRIVFLPRHGRGHVHSPSTIPYRANIDALKRVGVTDLLSVSACGSFREELRPGDFVLVDQFIDRTFAREKSFFGTGCVAHVSLAHPTCARLSAACAAAARTCGITIHQGGTYLAMEGPQFSTVAESRMYRDVWGCDVIGMTNMPEAKLAREAEICYASIAMVTDYDSWHEGHGTVDIAEIVRVLGSNADKARKLVGQLPRLLAGPRDACPHGCDHALDHAILTAKDRRDPDLVARLDAVAGRVLGA